MSCGAGLGAGLGMGCGGAGLVGGLAATNSFRFMLHPTTKNGRRLPLTLGGECPGECSAHGCRIGADGRHRENAPAPEPCVVMGLHNPSIGRIATIVAVGRAQRIGRGEVVESCPQPTRGP